MVAGSRPRRHGRPSGRVEYTSTKDGRGPVVFKTGDRSCLRRCVSLITVVRSCRGGRKRRAHQSSAHGSVGLRHRVVHRHAAPMRRVPLIGRHHVSDCCFESGIIEPIVSRPPVTAEGVGTWKGGSGTLASRKTSCDRPSGTRSVKLPGSRRIRPRLGPVSATWSPTGSGSHTRSDPLPAVVSIDGPPHLRSPDQAGG